MGSESTTAISMDNDDVYEEARDDVYEEAWDDVYEEARDKFEDEFEFSKMDRMMHRFPAGLRDEVHKKYQYMVEPRFVAIGPYHRGKPHLEKMEEVKNAAAYCLCHCFHVQREKAMKEVRGVLEEARKYYFGKKITVDMMFRDACFLLMYMDVYNRSYSMLEDYGVNPSMRRFLFSNRDCIESDIMLLENQIPWLVIQTLVDLAKNDLSQLVEKFIIGMGNSFKITESSCDDPSQKNKESCGFFKKKTVSCDDPPGTYDEWNDKKNPPAHLLEVLRRHKTTSKSVRLGTSNLSPPERTKIKAMSPKELEEIGIKLRPSQRAAFSDIRFQKGRLNFSRDLILPPLFLNDTVASCLVNMAAHEVCTASRFGDHADRTAVCSYVALLAFFMLEDEDVRRLRTMHLLEGPHSHDDMRTFFTTVSMHLPDRGYHFSVLMADINKYRSKSYRIAIYRWLYNNYLTIVKLVSVIGTIIGVCQALLSVARKK